MWITQSSCSEPQAATETVAKSLFLIKSEDDLLVQASVPDELRLVWDRQDDEQLLAVCRLLVAGHCLYGVDKNPLAVDLAKASLWLITAASGLPLTFLDHRLRCGDSLLGIPAEEVVRPWIEPQPAKGKGKARKTRTIKPVELLISPAAPQETFDYYVPNRDALCRAFRRAFVYLQALEKAVEAEPTNFSLHRSKYDALRGLLEPWNHLHQLRVGLAFADDASGGADLINTWLGDLLKSQTVSEEHRAKGELSRHRGEGLAAFCWELEFPEVFFDSQGRKWSDAGFSCVLGNPPWDKIKPERDGFYLQFDPLIRQLQGTEKNRHIEKLHRERPEVLAEWERHEATQKGLAGVLLKGGIYEHQTAEVEEEIEGDDGETKVKRKTTGGDPDMFKFFLERAWHLVAANETVGLVVSSGLHQGQGSTGLRRLILEQCKLRLLVKFDNEMNIFPDVLHNQKFVIVVFNKNGSTDSFDAAFFSRESAEALQTFRSHPDSLRLELSDVRHLSPETLTFFEFRGRRDLDIVRKAYSLHPPFGQGLMPKLGLKYRTEFHMGNMAFLFRDRAWLRRHGCTQEPGEKWRAADAAWYRSRDYVERPIAVWYAVFDGDTPLDYRVPWPIPKSKTLRRSDLDDFKIRLDLPGGLSLYGQGPDDGDFPTVFFPGDEGGPSNAPVYVPGRKFLGDLMIPPCLRPTDVFLPFMEGKWISQYNPGGYAYVAGGGSWVFTRPAALRANVVPHYFILRLDAATRTPVSEGTKLAFRNVARWSAERTLIGTQLQSSLPCGDQLPTLCINGVERGHFGLLECWANSFIIDFIVRLISGGHVTLGVLSRLPAPETLDAGLEFILCKLSDGDPQGTWTDEDISWESARRRATIDAVVTSLFERV